MLLQKNALENVILANPCFQLKIKAYEQLTKKACTFPIKLVFYLISWIKNKNLNQAPVVPSVVCKLKKFAPVQLSIIHVLTVFPYIFADSFV